MENRLNKLLGYTVQLDLSQLTGQLLLFHRCFDMFVAMIHHIIKNGYIFVALSLPGLQPPGCLSLTREMEKSTLGNLILFNRI